VTLHVKTHASPRGARRSAAVGGGRDKAGGDVGSSGTSSLAGATTADAALLLGGADEAGKRASSHRPAKSAATHASKSKEGRLPPIVTTITKIVGIVPLWVQALIGALILLAFAFAIRSRLVARRAKRLALQRGELLEDVGLLQSALLPLPPSKHGAIKTSAAYRPADGPAAGGDFYDVFGLEDGSLAVIVGDVSGHGRAALPRTALVRFTLRAYLEAGLTPRQALQTAGSVLERQLGEGFATAAVLTFQPRDRTLAYACAGHPAPIVVGSQAVAPVTVCSAPPIGGGLRTGTRETTIEVPGGARICLHTDGITEARVGSELFGSKRLRKLVAELEPGASATELLDRVAAQTSSRPDDMAACLLDLDGDEQAPAISLEELELDAAQARGERAEQFLLACGVTPGEVESILAAARVHAERDGRVLLKIRRATGGAQVSLSANGEAQLRVASLARKAPAAVAS
jgi:serine phosphatase RsbU (regulator of sigma subunit)